MVFLEVEMQWNVLISPDELDAKGLLLQKAIMEDFANRKASKEHGYYVAVTSLNSIGEGKVRGLTGDVLKHGIFLKSGPMENIFLPEKMMKDYHYVAGENPVFLNDKHSKLEKDTTVRFKVLGFKWSEYDRQFQLLATLAGDFLGPV